jgi:hypothetical protein
VNELMITTSAYAHEDRLRSYELLAEATGLRRGTEARPTATSRA